jgi:hypothetical protein
MSPVGKIDVICQVEKFLESDPLTGRQARNQLLLFRAVCYRLLVTTPTYLLTRKACGGMFLEILMAVNAIYADVSGMDTVIEGDRLNDGRSMRNDRIEGSQGPDDYDEY